MLPAASRRRGLRTSGGSGKSRASSGQAPDRPHRLKSGPGFSSRTGFFPLKIPRLERQLNDQRPSKGGYNKPALAESDHELRLKACGFTEHLRTRREKIDPNALDLLDSSEPPCCSSVEVRGNPFRVFILRCRDRGGVEFLGPSGLGRGLLSSPKKGLVTTPYGKVRGGLWESGQNWTLSLGRERRS